jgi:UDP-N-acetylmuramoylalanine--D-glutamate ligase
MIPVTSFRDKSVAVFGLGESGRVSALALTAGGATVAAWDDDEAAVAAARAAGIAIVDLHVADWKRFAALVLAPGVPLTHPAPHWTVTSAQAAGIEVIGDIELFCRERRLHCPEAPFIAITGTNGKSTTTALIAHLIAIAGHEVALGGNIGKAVLSLEPPRRGRFHVIECSSFQIDLAPSLDPAIGVLLNVTPDHIDRHGTFAAYAALKQRLVADSKTAVIAVDDKPSQAIADRVARSGTRVIRISNRRPLADGVYASGEEIVAVADGASLRVASLAGIGALRGAHNAQNAAAAVAVARACGLDQATIVKGLKSFPGLAHRMEEVGRRGRVLFVNDSKATNADAAAKALASFAPIYWIAGGRPKEGGIVPLIDFFPRIARAYLIGEAAADFANTLGDRVSHVISGTLDAAVGAAAADAAADPAAEPVVLLSPACASYDQFKNFERRGDAFRALVLQLDGITSQGEAA